MKQFKFNNKPSLIVGIREGLPKKKRNIDRIIYLIIISVIFFSIITYIIQKNIYVYSYGEVITSRFEVNQPDDIIITQYYIDENSTVKIGDTLFSFKSNLNDDINTEDKQITFNGEIINNPNEWINKEKLNTEKLINLKNLDIKHINNTISLLNDNIETLKYEVMLDLKSPSILNEKRSEIERLKIDKQKNIIEISYLKKYLNQINIFDDSIQKQKQKQIQLSNFNNNKIILNYYTSPISGVITKITKPENEVSFRKDVIMYITNIDDIHIRGFIEQNDLEHFKIGDKVNLRFFDGTKSVGYIKDFYINTENVPIPFRKIRDKDQRNVVATILPTNNDEKKTWKSYYQFTVQMYKIKYF